jgi:hypothetical protein
MRFALLGPLRVEGDAGPIAIGLADRLTAGAATGP